MECKIVYSIFFDPGEVTEIRAYGLSGKNKAWSGWARGAGIVYGYFDNAEAFGRAADALEAAKAPGIYFTLNPVNPDLLARAENRLKAADQKSSSTTDQDIVCIRWLPIDLDPVRPSGISSSDDELKAALVLRDKILESLRKDGLRGIPACSGNGAHICVYIKDGPNTETRKDVIRRALLSLHQKYSTDQVEVDQAVFNPSRIWKVYGTTARKGDHTKRRPHRKSYIEPSILEGLSGKRQ